MENTQIIPPGEIHLWSVSMNDAQPHMETLGHSLTAEEHDRAARYRMPARSERFVMARGVLRWVLGQTTGVAPGVVSFDYGPNGKPFLSESSLFFNASDSGDFVVVALASDEIGIDMEVLRPMTRRDRLAKRICSDREYAAFAALPEAEKNTVLLRLWTCKEAGLKATGIGLTGGMQNVEVDFGPNRDSSLRRLIDDQGGWTLLPVDVHETIVCTIIVRGTGWALVRHAVESLFD